MKPSNEIRIFGFIDPSPPPPGSWKEKVFELVELAEETNPVAEEIVVHKFAVTEKRMRAAQAEIISRYITYRRSMR